MNGQNDCASLFSQLPQDLEDNIGIESVQSGCWFLGGRKEGMMVDSRGRIKAISYFEMSLTSRIKIDGKPSKTIPIDRRRL